MLNNKLDRADLLIARKTFSLMAMPDIRPHDVVVYHVAIVAIEREVLEDILVNGKGCVLRTAGISLIWNYAGLLTHEYQLSVA